MAEAVHAPPPTSQLDLYEWTAYKKNLIETNRATKWTNSAVDNIPLAGSLWLVVEEH